MSLQQPATYSLNALSVELGIDRRTLARRLADVKPAEGTGSSKRWRLRDALDALRENPVQVAPPRSSRAAYRGGYDLVDAYLLEVAGPIATMTGEEVVGMFNWTDADFAELLGWGMPFIKAGTQNSPRDWVLGFTHSARWLASVARDVHADIDSYLPGRLRAIRGARRLCVPAGFRAFKSEAERRDR